MKKKNRKKDDIKIKLIAYKMGFIAMNILFYITIFIIFSYLHPTSNQNQNNFYSISYPSLEVNFMDNFTQEEEIMIESIIRDLDPIYYQFINQINFTKDWNDIQDFCTPSSETVVGCNYEDRILLYYNDYSKEWMREGICHEIFHTLITFGGEKAHSVIYDLGEKGVCYR